MLKTFLLVGALVVLPIVALAQGNDPKILLDQDSLGPPSVTNINNISPSCTDGGISGSGTCTYDFINNIGNVIDGFTFDAIFDFNPDTLDFSGCDGSYFSMVCSETTTQLTSSTYQVQFVFTEQAGVEGAQEPGVLPIGDGFDPTFHIVLVGWSQYANDIPSFTSSYSVPEPSAVLIFLTELLLLIGLAKLSGLRWNRSWRGTVQSE
jgi:hypothetical protein